MSIQPSHSTTHIAIWPELNSLMDLIILILEQKIYEALKLMDIII